MAEGDSGDAWVQIAGKITAIKEYTKEKEAYLSQLLDAINGLAYPVEKFKCKVLFIFVECLEFIWFNCCSLVMQCCANCARCYQLMMKFSFQSVHTLSLI